jgi:DNA mismatch repair ATPase MutL
MRSEATENYHLTSIVQHYALAHPEIAFTLTNNGREVLQVTPAKDLRERAFQIFGAGLLESLLPVGGGRDHVAKVAGFISAPRERRTNKDSQYFFVNRRFVRDKVIAGGLLEGFRSVLPHGVYPVAFLFVDVPLEEIDVNVHPAKTEIRFRRGEAVKDVIAEAVREALASAGIVAESVREVQTEEIAVSAAVSFVDAPPVTEQPSMRFGVARVESVDIQAGVVEEGTDETAASLSVEGLYERFVSEVDDSEISREFERDAEARESEVPVEIPPGFKSAVLPPLNSAERFTKPAEVADVSGHKIRPIAQLHDSFHHCGRRRRPIARRPACRA